jgi:hypothetical protein
MSDMFMSTVEVLRIADFDAFHKAGYCFRRCLNQHVHVIAHQTKGMDLYFSAPIEPLDSFQKSLVVILVHKYIHVSDSAEHDMTEFGQNSISWFAHNNLLSAYHPCISLNVLIPSSEISTQKRTDASVLCC